LRKGGHKRSKGARKDFSRIFAVLSLLAIFHLAFAPLARAAAPPPASVEQLAADLKATFGDAVQLCVNVDDDGSQPGAPAHHGEGECPLCCLHAVSALVPPDVTKLSAPRLASSSVSFAATDFSPPPPARASPAQPRAPPAKS